jgi:hypothetical protein
MWTRKLKFEHHNGRNCLDQLSSYQLSRTILFQVISYYTKINIGKIGYGDVDWDNMDTVEGSCKNRNEPTVPYKSRNF